MDNNDVICTCLDLTIGDIKKAIEDGATTFEEVQAYCESRGNKVDAKQFYDYFTASDWVDSKGNEVKSWKQKIITWESYRKDDKSQNKVGANGIAIKNEKSDLEGVF